MEANLDSIIKLSGLNNLNERNVDLDRKYDDEFLTIYEDILEEAAIIKDKPVKREDKPLVKKKKEGKKIVLVESVLSDNPESFARNIYIKVLGREPDSSGYGNLFSRIKNDKNIDKEFLVYQYWKSPEGQKRNIEVIGFHKIYMDELLSHEGKDFVEHTFLQILGRKPNEEDTLGYYSFVYREGNSKEEAIKKIKESDEGTRRKVVIEGFEKAYKRRKFKENILAKPVIGNLVLAVWNLFHINRRLAEVNDSIAKVKTDCANQISQVEEQNKVLEETLADMRNSIQNLYNPEAETEYLERMNMLLSVRKTLWGDERRLHISKRASVSTCFFNTNSGDITIGDYTFAGSNVSILTGSHNKNLTGLLRRDVPEDSGHDIVIGNGVWLGSNSTILGPATIGDNAVIAAGAIVTPGTNVAPNTVCAGIPARQLGSELNISNEKDSESILKAFERKDGILFTKGWSEETTFVYAKEGILGHYLYDSVGEMLLKPGTYQVKYAFKEDAPISLTINTGAEIIKQNLLDKEGCFEITIHKYQQNERNCLVSFEVDLTREDFAISVVRQ